MLKILIFIKHLTKLYNIVRRKRLFKACDIKNIEKLLYKDTNFPHPIGIVISKAAKIGYNCTIYQNVTIGSKTQKSGNYSPKNYPQIGNNVTIYAGAVILGGITIGNNAIIGANSVVNKNIPPNTIVGGIPAKIIKHDLI